MDAEAVLLALLGATNECDAVRGQVLMSYGVLNPNRSL
jgi:hypothetical protein